MSKMFQSSRRDANKSELMRTILAVRYTDLDQERELCKQLLEVAEPEQDDYGAAFANVYMVDSLLALGDFAACDFYVIRATLLCRERGYDQLMLVLCNLAGLYFSKRNDEQTALQYYLEGLLLARQEADCEAESKLLNNIGICFGGRGAWLYAKKYFAEAFAAAERGGGSANATSYLCNLSEACLRSNDLAGCEQALLQCDNQPAESTYQKIRRHCAWCTYYAALRDQERCIEQEQILADIGFFEYENHFFIDDMCVGIGECMLEIGDHVRALRYLTRLQERADEVAPVVRFRAQELRIRYLEQYGEPAQLDEAYRVYYEIERLLSRGDDEARAQSILSKIQLTQMQLSRESICKENRLLEDASQLDELSGLYNRRYFNKLITKTVQGQTLHTLGFIVLDLDYFKNYNDTYGHFMGDGALRAVGEVLAQHAKDGIFASRYGGDEFACLCVNLEDADILAYIRKVEASMRDRQIINKNASGWDFLTLSIGYSNEPYTSQIEPQLLFHLADQALYEVKQAGRAGHARKFLCAERGETVVERG